MATVYGERERRRDPAVLHEAERQLIDHNRSMGAADKQMIRTLFLRLAAMRDDDTRVTGPQL